MAFREDIDLGVARVRKLTVTSGITGDVTGNVTGDVAGVITPTAYTVATLPTAADSTGIVAYCSDGDTGDPCLMFCTGTSWLRIAFGAAVAAS